MKLPEVFAEQAEACRRLDSPFMGRLLDLVGEKMDRSTEIGRRLHDWPGDIGPGGASVPLRLAGGLHALANAGFPALRAVFPPAKPSDGQLWRGVYRAVHEMQFFLDQWLDSPPQTNEVRRSAALLPAAAMVSERFGQPLRLIELGASAGLNLHFDRFAVETPGGTIGASEPALMLTPDWRGEAPEAAPINVASRAGCDLMPIDPRDPEGEARLLAYLWADQGHRLDLTRAAISVSEVAVTKADAADFLAQALKPKRGQTRFLFHTVAWQYFPPETQEKARTLIEAAGATADENRPLAWFSMENTGDGAGAVLTLRLWPGDLKFDLGRADFHGRWIDWRRA